MNDKQKHTIESLKAMPLAARYEAIREGVEQPDLFSEDVSLLHEITGLCVRRTLPKKYAQRRWTEFGRANRWNFDEEAELLPPSLTASSPDALYRLMHFVRPKKFVAKMDYYKGGIFRFFSPDRRYLCWVAFHKCEIDLGFFCPQKDLMIPVDPPWPESLRLEPKTEEEAKGWYNENGPWQRFLAQPENRVVFDAHRAAQDAYRAQGIVVPWCSRKMRCQRAAGQAWMRLIVTIANTPMDIYPGNSFTV